MQRLVDRGGIGWSGSDDRIEGDRGDIEGGGRQQYIAVGAGKGKSQLARESECVSVSVSVRGRE